jgi:hypothetical protein
VQLTHAADRILERPVEVLQGVRAATEVGHPKQEIGVLGGQVEGSHLALDPDEIPAHELVEDPFMKIERNADRLQEPRIQGRVPDAHAVVVKPGRIQRRTEDGECLGRARRSRRADQLHARLQKLA